MLLRAALALGALLLTSAHTAAQDTTQYGALRFVAWPATRALADALLAATRTSPLLPGMGREVLLEGETVTILVTPDERAFRERTGGQAPEWGAGVAFPEANLVVLPGYTSERGGTQDLRRVLRHELAHVALQRRLGHVRVPRWFTEGYATWSAQQLDEDAAWLLRLAFIFDRAPSLDSLELAWPARATDARVAYLLSATAIDYLHAQGTPQTFERFLAHWAEDGSFERALRASYRISSAQFERLWRREVRQRYGWLLFLTQGAVLTLFFTAAALVLFFIRRRRDRRRLAALRATEPADLPAYWLEPPEDETATDRPDEPRPPASP